MASTGSIDYNTDVNTFLDYKSETTAAEVTKAFGQGGLEGIDSDFTQPLTTEMSKGLSKKALSINGRAPLNDIAIEIKKRIIVTLDDIEDLKKLVVAEGNQHRKKEANVYFEKVKEHYQEMCKEVEDLAEKYYNYKDGIKGYKGEGDDKEKIYFEPRKVKVTYDGTPYKSLIDMGPEPDSDNKYAGDLNKKLKAAQDFWEKYEIAKENKELCDSLSTSMSGIGTHVSNDDAKKIEGVQPGAKKDTTYSDGRRHITETYTNPDGSTVVIKKTRTTENGTVVERTTSHQVRNSEGWLDEEVKYDSEGKPTKKIVYERHQIEAGKSAFEVKSKEYEYKNGSFSTNSTDGETIYEYRDKEGKIHTVNEQPNMDDVRKKSVDTNADKELESGNGSEAVDSTTSSEVEIKGEKLVVADSFEQLRDEIVGVDKPKSFVIKKGDTLYIDKPNSPLNEFIKAEDSDRYFVYDEDDKRYYEIDENGDKITTSDYDIEKIIGGTGNKDNIGTSNNSRLEHSVDDAELDSTESQ